jgi:aminomethyltransferase
LDISPVEASASWAIGWKKESFLGSDVLVSHKNGLTERKSVAIKSLDRGIPRAGMSVKNSAGQIIGEVTSGTFSPTLKHGIALALVSREVVIGDQVVIDVRGRESSGEVVKLPFVTSHVR